MGHMEVTDLVREGDLDLWLSCAFVLACSLRSFLEIREDIENILDGRSGERLVRGTAGMEKLFIVKEKDYELLNELKKDHDLVKELQERI